MKLKFTITGSKAHDVEYRQFLGELAMGLALKGFETYNDENAVVVLLEADERRAQKFLVDIASEEGNTVVSEEYTCDVMPIWQFAWIFTATALTKLTCPRIVQIKNK